MIRWFSALRIDQEHLDELVQEMSSETETNT